MQTLNAPGGSAYGMCEKHKVPLIHTVTEQTLCAVCVAARLAQAIDALQELYDVQNGPPLIRDKDRWVWAMEKANAALCANGLD